ncbi:MAG: polysaccharide export protein [Proteobacteria bacterium]|nr:MAG: polysaccharide export protein [Pseudomonadota bacterium]
MWNRSIRCAMLVGLALLTTGCAGGRGGPISYEPDNFGVPDKPKVAAVDDLYTLAPLDTITVSVYQVPELSRDYQIDQSGRLTMPLIGRIDAVGVGTTDLASTIAQRLGEKYLRNPNVVISLKESASQVVTIDGSVRQPGIYPATAPLSLVKVIALARGTDELANLRRVAIFRTIGGYPAEPASGFHLHGALTLTRQYPT